MPSLMSKAVASGETLFITYGDPNHYNHGKLLWKEVKQVGKEQPQIGDFIRDYTQELKEDKSKPSEDVLADVLSDACPIGWDFVVRTDAHGNSNWCYVPKAV